MSLCNQMNLSYVEITSARSAMVASFRYPRVIATAAPNLIAAKVWHVWEQREE